MLVPSFKLLVFLAFSIPISEARRNSPGFSSLILTNQQALVQFGSLSIFAAALLALARYFKSYFPFSMSQRIIAKARAASLPGFMGSHFQALAAALESRWSATAILSFHESRPWVILLLRYGG